jgi:hypothetical protein
VDAVAGDESVLGNQAMIAMLHNCELNVFFLTCANMLAAASMLLSVVAFAVCALQMHTQSV